MGWVATTRPGFPGLHPTQSSSELGKSRKDTGSSLERGTTSSDHSSVPFLLFVHFSPVKIVVTRTLLITADLLVGLALVALLLGLDCIKFLKEEPCVKLKMCYGAGVILGIGSAWSGAFGDSWGTGSQRNLLEGFWEVGGSMVCS